MSHPGRVLSRLLFGLLLIELLLGSRTALALLPTLGGPDIEAALEAGRTGVAQEDFGEEWRVPLPDGEIVVTTPFARLAQAARQAALKGDPLSDKQRAEQLDRGKGRIQLMVTMRGGSVDFARWFQPVLMVGDKEVKPSFVQNERTALRLEDGHFAARNVYVFPLEGIPPRGTVTLVVQHSVDRKVVLRAPVDLSKMR
jgi:hypothetical protein